MRHLFDVDDLSGDLCTIEADFSLAAERDGTRDEREEGVIFAHADVGAGKDLRSALADDDRARLCLLTIRKLHTEEFRLRVSQVSCCTSGFSMCHKFLSCIDSGLLSLGDVGSNRC